MPTANFQINGTFGTTTHLKVSPTKGFTNYSICAWMFLIHYRGTYNSVLSYGNSYEIPDLIFIGTRRLLIQIKEIAWSILIPFPVLEPREGNYSDSGVTISMCERSQDSTKYCLELVLDHAPFEIWKHFCMTVEHTRENNGPNSETIIKGYIDGQLFGTSMLIQTNVLC